MANVHEFGIMDTAPLQNERYDSFEPDKYNCIQINDDFIEKIINKKLKMNMYMKYLIILKKYAIILNKYSFNIDMMNKIINKIN